MKTVRRSPKTQTADVATFRLHSLLRALVYRMDIVPVAPIALTVLVSQVAVKRLYQLSRQSYAVCAMFATPPRFAVSAGAAGHAK